MNCIANTTYRSLTAVLFGFAAIVGGISLAQEPEEQDKVVPIEIQEQVKELFEKCFAHRQLIKSGTMRIVHTLSGYKKNGNLENARTREMFLAFDEERQRVDVRDKHKRNPYGSSHVMTGCIGCYEGNKRILVEYSRYNKKNVPPSESILSIYDTELKFKGSEIPNRWTQRISFIPQNLILFSTNRFPIKGTIENTKDILLSNTIKMMDSSVTDVIVTDEIYKETNCKRITFDSTFTDGANVIVSLWFAEGQGFALRKHSLQISGSESMNYDELFETDVALDRGSGIWFPSAWHYERNDEGKSLYAEDGTVNDVVLNKPIEEKIFTMQDIDIIPAGALVLWNTDKFPHPYGEKRRGALLWDGNKVVTRGMFAEGMVEKHIEENREKWQSKRFRIILCINIAGVCLFIAFALWYYYRQMKKSH